MDAIELCETRGRGYSRGANGWLVGTRGLLKQARARFGASVISPPHKDFRGPAPVAKAAFSSVLRRPSLALTRDRLGANTTFVPDRYAQRDAGRDMICAADDRSRHFVFDRQKPKGQWLNRVSPNGHGPA